MRAGRKRMTIQERTSSCAARPSISQLVSMYAIADRQTSRIATPA